MRSKLLPKNSIETRCPGVLPVGRDVMSRLPVPTQSIPACPGPQPLRCGKNRPPLRIFNPHPRLRLRRARRAKTGPRAHNNYRPHAQRWPTLLAKVRDPTPLFPPFCTCLAACNPLYTLNASETGGRDFSHGGESPRVFPPRLKSEPPAHRDSRESTQASTG
jgi:hypothetical protein